ncbi:MAG: mechanosensitive ion channel family protein [Paracoccaceae bacterium]
MPSIRRLALLAVVLLTPFAAATAQEADAPEPPALPSAVVAPGTPTDELVVRLTPLTRDELAAAAEEWLGLVKAKTQEIVEAQLEARSAEGPAATTAAERADALAQERRGLFDSYAAILEAWEKKTGDADAIAAYRAYRNAILVDETRTADAATLARRALVWATSPDGGVGLAIDVAIVVGAILGLVIVARLVRRIARRGLERVSTLSRLLKAFFVGVVYWIVLSFGLLVVLSALGIDVTPIFALIGGASFILAFALQSTLGNLASGVMIMLNRPFDEGDYVSVAGTAGTVKSVSVMSTTVITPDNQVIVIPNSRVWGDVITNVTASPERRVDLTFGIGYDDDMEQAQSILARLCKAHPLVLDEPETVIRVGALGESSVDLICRPWTKGADYWTVYWDLQQQVKAAFDAEGISIPYPQRDVHLRAVGSDDAEASAPIRTRRGGRGGFARDDEGEAQPGVG